MSEFKKINLNENRVKYWDGTTNLLARYLAYFLKCVDLINQGKYILAFAGLGVFKSDVVISFWYLIAGGLVAVPLMIIIGRWYMHKAQKTMEFVNQLLGTVTGYDTYNMQVKQLELLEEISKKLHENISNRTINTK